MLKPLTISVIIPTKEARGTLHTCLTALYQSTYQQYEIIAVDDGIDQEAAQILASFPCRVVTNSGKGVSAARNTGANAASGDVLLFIDSDVVVRTDTLDRIAVRMNDETVTGVVGVLSAALPYEDFFSQYKNLWMHYTYMIIPDQVSLFYTSIAAIRREIFLSLGGFDELYTKPSVEDTDFGHRLGTHGLTIWSDKALQVTHLKQYTFWQTVKTDFARSAALVKHVLRSKSAPGIDRFKKTSVPIHFIVAVGMTGLLILAGFGSLLFAPLLTPWVLLLGWCGICLANVRFLTFLFMCRGFKFGLYSSLFLPVDLASVALGIFSGLVSYYKGSRY